MDRHLVPLSVLLASGAVPLVAYSQVYLTDAEALKAIFPGEALAKKEIELTPADAEKIESLSGEKVRNRGLSVWAGPGKSALFVDQVLGKHEFITYAVGITGKGAVRGVEILEYRETYGSEVRTPEWRKQFVGKDSSAPLKVGSDIVNLSGATLSSSHVSAGVRRLLHTYGVIRDRL